MVGIVELLVLGLALGADAFSVSVAVGTRRLNWSIILKLTLLIGSLHILMPLLGINLGRIFNLFFGCYYHQFTIDKISRGIGAGVLAILGMIMVHDNLVNNKDDYSFNLYGIYLFILAVSVSIDALSVGFSLNLLQAGMIISCLVLGLVAAGMVLVGLILGRKLGSLADRAELIGGIALILLGLKILLNL